MTTLSLGPGPLREADSPSSEATTDAPTLICELGELERLNSVGVGHGVRLGLRSLVRTVNVTTPFLSCWEKKKVEENFCESIKLMCDVCTLTTLAKSYSRALTLPLILLLFGAPSP